MRITLLYIILLFLFRLPLFSQDTTKITLPVRIVGGDTLPSVDLNGVTIFPPGKFENKREAVRYDRLVYNIKIVYPYAKLAGLKLKQIKAVLDTIKNDKQKKAFLRKSEKELDAQFGDQLRDMTYSQGKILIKLIYRETGSSTFAIVKELKGGFNAFVWQTLARIFGYDLKSLYNPKEEDEPIERVVQMIDAGAI
ncbi:MAG: DUF4294 domain-containing protein [Bacteroidetes bacterium]|nr:DUF4294 domain-containing protein [Bacteroidota bacterium]